MTYGVKVSKIGKSVSSATPTDFIMSSEWGTIKFFKYGAGSKTVNASSVVTETITHNAGFFPIVVLYVELTPTSGRWYLAPFNLIATEDTYISGSVDDTGAHATTFQFKIINTTASQKTVSYYYFVIGESGK